MDAVTDAVKGAVVISGAGRDKGDYLAIVAANAERVFVCNGRDRPLAKAKNPAHLTMTGLTLPPEAMRGNRALKKALRRIRTETEAKQNGVSPEL